MSRRTVTGRVLHWAIRLPHRKGSQNDTTAIYGILRGKRYLCAIYEFPRRLPERRCAAMALYDYHRMTDILP